MTTLKTLYIASLITLVASLFLSPKANLLDGTFVILFTVTVAIPLPILPLIMLSKSEKYYTLARKEKRIRGPLDNKPSSIEEEYRFDSIILATLFVFLYVICSVTLWL